MFLEMIPFMSLNTPEILVPLHNFSILMRNLDLSKSDPYRGLHRKTFFTKHKNIENPFQMQSHNVVISQQSGPKGHQL